PKPPVNSVPPTQTTLEDTPRTFSASAGNAITVSDPDAGNGNVKVTLTVTGGSLAMGGVANLTVTGNGTSSLTATGPISALNAGLNGLVFTPASALNGNGAASIQVLSNDLGSAGAGRNLTDTDTVAINITPVN